MSRINTNVQSLIAQRVLGNNNKGLGQSLERLSTGLRINRGKDDPAGLIASESLRSAAGADSPSAAGSPSFFMRVGWKSILRASLVSPKCRISAHSSQ